MEKTNNSSRIELSNGLCKCAMLLHAIITSVGPDLCAHIQTIPDKSTQEAADVQLYLALDVLERCKKELETAADQVMELK